MISPSEKQIIFSDLNSTSRYFGRICITRPIQDIFITAVNQYAILIISRPT